MNATADIPAITARLLEYCRGRDWAGYDPYDALNSRVFRATPFARLAWCRLAFTQFMKRSPVNIRPLLAVPRRRNPKGTALFVMALLNLRKAGPFDGDETIRALVADLIAARSPAEPRSAWGYGFDWQTRTYRVPGVTPNIICTTFAGNALLEAWEPFRDEACLHHAVSAAEFLVQALREDLPGGAACFRYTPLASTRIHNANLLGAAYCARVAAITRRDEWRELAVRAAGYSAGRQSEEGAWRYGEAGTQRWVDHFHTGYNLCALHAIARHTGSGAFDGALARGLDFYLEHFFTAEGAPRYYHDRTYPVDVHSVAQAIITLGLLAGRDARCAPTREAVVRWAVRHLLHPDGYFMYQKRRFGTNRIPYMRWGQAWMLLALSTLAEAGTTP
jgi:hypothetical protein